MRLSTFNSSSAPAKAIAVLLALLISYMAFLEIAARVALPALSEGIGRVTTDYRDASQIQAKSHTAPPGLLLVGNSLLLDGVDRHTLVESLSPAINTSMLPIEGTSYYDWYFGMQRLFAEGSRPSTLVLCINARQMISNSTNGEFFAHFLMRIEDLPEVIRVGKLSTMASSNYLFSHWSMWLATRTNVRIGLTERLLPGANELAARFSVRDGTAMDSDPEISKRVLERLRKFNDLAKSYGAEFVWLVPPTTNLDDPSPDLQELAQAEGIRVLIPYLPGKMPVDHYADGFHLNRAGSKDFTEQLIPLIRASTKVQPQL